jgi:hypothetical protein
LGPKRKTRGTALDESQSSKRGKIVEHSFVGQSTGNIPCSQQEDEQRYPNNGSFPGW